MTTTIVWFRRALRLADQPALHAARARGGRVVPVYVHAPEEESPWKPGAASRAYLDRSLRAFADSLERLGAPLVIRRGPTIDALARLVDEAGANAVHFDRAYELHLAKRDRRVVRALRKLGVEVASHNASLFAEPDAVATKTGGPYKVFTPYWRAVRASLEPEEPLPAPRRLDGVQGLESLDIDALALRPARGWDAAFDEHWSAGERGAHRALERFLEHALPSYATDRDRPAVDGTSLLSAPLHFGEIGPRQVLWALARRGQLEVGEKFLSELGWREFSAHLLHHFPRTTKHPLNPVFERFAWAPHDAHAFDAWKRGRTGVPIVDAGMRQLWAHGWMHNRVRMLVASFLTKNLLLPWQLGARWFWDTLCDADLANNTQGWQWTAGSGADASPYFRIFNPVTQGERFDPDGDYVKRWIPELAQVPAAHVHAPWRLPHDDLARLALADSPYARPIVDLSQSRDAALDAWRRIKA